MSCVSSTLLKQHQQWPSMCNCLSRNKDIMKTLVPFPLVSDYWKNEHKLKFPQRSHTERKERWKLLPGRRELVSWEEICNLSDHPSGESGAETMSIRGYALKDRLVMHATSFFFKHKPHVKTPKIYLEVGSSLGLFIPPPNVATLNEYSLSAL